MTLPLKVPEGCSFAQMCILFVLFWDVGRSISNSIQLIAFLVFQNLKTTLCNSPVLLTLYFKQEFVVQTDVSETGLGVVPSCEWGATPHSIPRQKTDPF